MKDETIFSRSFSQYEQKKFGHWLIIGSLIIIWSICTVLFHYCDPTTVLNLQHINSTSREADHDMSLASAQRIKTAKYPIEPINFPVETKVTSNKLDVENVEKEVKQIMEIKKRQNETSIDDEAEPREITRLSCNVSEPKLSYCSIKGNIKIQGNSSTILLSPIGLRTLRQSWSVSPYVRKNDAAAMMRVRKWYMNATTASPTCTRNHTIPAILFSSGGFSGNTFHDFSDIIVPLYLTSKRFNGEVQFLVSDYKPWWVNKFKVILRHLSNYEIINTDSDQEVKCYKQLIIGLKYHKELSIDPSRLPNSTLITMNDFKRFLRSAFSLGRTTAINVHDRDGKRPRLMIISRNKSRSFTNEDKIVKMARRVGYDVTVAEARLSTNLSNFAQEVNSCDVLMGVHGAGLTNMVFLPENAVVIQIIPFGKIDGLARNCFKEPAKDMDLKYLEYKIRIEESSLIQQFPMNHSIIRDPLSIRRHGWVAVKSTYLDKQNVRPDVRKFRVVLLKALKLLHR